MNVQEILAKHPAPWRYSTIAATVTVYDAAGVEVPLFTLLDFTVAVTQIMAKRAAQPA